MLRGNFTFFLGDPGYGIKSEACQRAVFHMNQDVVRR